MRTLQFNEIQNVSGGNGGSDNEERHNQFYYAYDLPFSAGIRAQYFCNYFLNSSDKYQLNSPESKGKCVPTIQRIFEKQDDALKEAMKKIS